MIAEPKVKGPVAGGPSPNPAVAELELHLLLEAVHRVSGYDFREYAPGTLKRRVAERMRAENVTTTTGLLERVLHVDRAMARFVEALSHTVSSPFRSRRSSRPSSNACCRACGPSRTRVSG